MATLGQASSFTGSRLRRAVRDFLPRLTVIPDRRPAPTLPLFAFRAAPGHQPRVLSWLRAVTAP